MNFDEIKNCAVQGCRFSAIDRSIDGKWRCVGHHKELADALSREREKEEQRKRVEERLYVEMVLHADRETAKEYGLTDSALRFFRERAKRYAAALVDAEVL